MAQLTREQFTAKYDNFFADNNIENITEETFREFRDDVRDTFALIADIAAVPIGPAVNFDPLTRVLTATHVLGTSELEYTHNNGGFSAYVEVQVDDLAHGQGEWRYRVKGATGRNPSITTDSPRIEVKAVVNPAGPGRIKSTDISDSTEAGRALLTAADVEAQRKLLDQLNLLPEEYGPGQPGFDKLFGDEGALAYLLRHAGDRDQPAAPTHGQVNDSLKEFTFTVNPAYPSYTQYKENGRPGTTAPAYLSAATAYQVSDTVHVTGLDGAAKNSLAYFVAGSGNVPDGQVLTNSEAFTGAPVVVTPPPATKATAPYFGAIDDVTNTVSLGSAYSFTEVRWGLEGQGPQALGSNSICSPGNIVGRLFAYVIADAATNRLQSDTVYSTAFTLAAAANNTPSVTLSVMGGVSSVTPGQSVTLLAEGQDADGLSDIDFIEYLDNGVKLAGGQTAGNSGSLQTISLTAGTHNFTLKITDKHGASSFSNVCIVTAAATIQLTELVAFGDSRTAPASRAGFTANWYEQALADPLLSSSRFVGKNNWARGGGYSVYHANDPNASYISFQLNEAVGSYRTDVIERLVAVFIGINDVQGGDSIEDIKAHFTTAIAQVKQSGASRIISATLVTSNYILFNDAKLADIWNKVQLFNTWLRNNYASIGIDILVDVATDKYMGGPSPGTNDTYFQSDQIHYTPAGAARTTAIFLKGIQLFLQGRSGIVVSDELYTAPLPGTSTGSLSDITPFNVLAGGAYTAQGVATGAGSDAFGKTGLNTQTPRPAGQEVRLGTQYTEAKNFTASLGFVGNTSAPGHANYLAGFYLQTGGKIIYTINGVDFDSGLTVPLNYYICLRIKLNGKVSIEQSPDNLNWTERVIDFATITGQAWASFDVFGSTAAITVRSSNLGVYSETAPVTPPPGDLNIVFYDDFNRADGPMGNGWVHPEFFTLVNGAAVAVDSYPSGHPPMERPQSEAGNRQRATGTYLFNNTGRTPGLVVRSDGAGNYYMLYVTDFGTQYGISIYRITNYTQATSLGSLRSSMVLNPGSTYRISFVAYDDQLVATVLGTNGQPLGEGLRVTNTSFVSGVCGLTSSEVGNTFLDFTLSTV